MPYPDLYNKSKGVFSMTIIDVPLIPALFVVLFSVNVPHITTLFIKLFSINIPHITELFVMLFEFSDVSQSIHKDSF